MTLHRLIQVRRHWREVRLQTIAACEAHPKLLELLLYLRPRVAAHFRLRELLALAFICDMRCYRETGTVITGCQWVRDDIAGCPVPRPAPAPAGEEG